MSCRYLREKTSEVRGPSGGILASKTYYKCRVKERDIQKSIQIDKAVGLNLWDQANSEIHGCPIQQSGQRNWEKCPFRKP